MFLVSCKKEAAQNDIEGLKENVRETYAQIAFAIYKDSLIEAKKLQKEIELFLKEPSKAGLDKCRQAWLASREPYGLSEAFRFSNGPIDNEGLEGAINAWPLDESYIDYVRGNEQSGIINNSKDYPKINKGTVLKLNEQGAETNISTGFHAVEFLLWGQDQEDTSLKTPGDRSFKDFTDAPNAERRAAYLKITIDLLVEHLETICKEWDPQIKGNYLERYKGINHDKSLRDIFNGLFNFSKAELAGERMFVAIRNKDQEDEHSCFSDNTHRDIIQNFNGIRNLALGEYTRLNGEKVSGPGLIDLVEKADQEKAAQMRKQIAELSELMKGIPIPFDHALTTEVLGKGKLSVIVNKLMALGDSFAQSIKILKLQQDAI